MPTTELNKIGYTNSKLKLVVAFILLFGINSNQFAQIQPCGLHKNTISTNNMGDTLIANTNENLNYFSVDKGNTWEKHIHGFKETQRSPEKVSLGNIDISLDGRNYISINGTEFQITEYGEEINSLFVHDSILYISTTNDLYKLPIMEFCKKHVFDFMKGEWSLNYWRNEYYENPAKDYVNFTKFRIDDKKIYWYKAGFNAELNTEMVYQYSCGEYTDKKDSTGSTIEKNPILNFTFREVDLVKELDKNISKIGFSITNNQIYINKPSSISSNSGFLLENDCVEGDLRKIYLVDWRYLIIENNNQYVLYYH